MGIPRIAGEALYSAIMACVRAGNNTSIGIAIELDFSVPTIHTKLHELKAARRAYNTRRRCGGSDRQMIWVEGADPKTDAPDSDYGDEPFQIKLTTYPDIGRRDYLVAAFFGAPKASQAQGAV
jgi:hypothetical protein